MNDESQLFDIMPFQKLDFRDTPFPRSSDINIAYIPSIMGVRKKYLVVFAHAFEDYLRVNIVCLN